MSVLTSDVSEWLLLRVLHADQSNVGTREVCDSNFSFLLHLSRCCSLSYPTRKKVRLTRRTFLVRDTVNNQHVMLTARTSSMHVFSSPIQQEGRYVYTYFSVSRLELERPTILTHEAAGRLTLKAITLMRVVSLPNKTWLYIRKDLISIDITSGMYCKEKN